MLIIRPPIVSAVPQAAEVLGFSRTRWEQFLEDHRVLEHAYAVEDLERDVAALRRLREDAVTATPA